MASIHTNHLKNSKRSYTIRWRDLRNELQQETFKKKVDAVRFKNEIESSLDQGTYIDPRAGSILLADYLQTWQAHRHHLRPSTTARDDSYIRNHIVPELGDYRLDRLTRTIIKAWVKGRVSAGYAPATVRKAAGILAKALDDAVEDGLIATNPATKLDLPKVGVIEVRFLTSDEVWLLADTIDPRYRAFVLTGAFTGMRPGELRALRLDHLNMLGRTIQVEETLLEDKGRITAGPVKTKASRRQIRIPRFLVDELARHLAAYPPGDDGYIFTAPHGGPIRKDNFRRRTWVPATAAAGFEGLRVHDLRHTHAALLIALGKHTKVIQERLGHASAMTTLDRYGHLQEGLDEAAADELDEAYSRASVGF